MLVLSDKLLVRCREVLIQSGHFDTDEKVQYLFSGKELVGYQNKLRNASSREDRADMTVNLLLPESTAKGRPLLLLLLKLLINRTDKNTGLYRNLNQCCTDIEIEMLLAKAGFAYTTNDELALLPQEVIKIVQTLLTCFPIQDTIERAKVLSYLPGDISRSIQIDDENTDFANMLHIVEVCSRHPNSIERLAYAVYESEGKTNSWVKLDELMRGIFKHVVTYSRLQELQSITKEMKWTEEVLKKAYTASILDDWSYPNIYDKSAMLIRMLEELATASMLEDVQYPILTFVEHLAAYAQRQKNQNIEGQLHKWVNERAEELKLSTDMLNKIRDAVSDYNLPDQSYLLIEIDEASKDMYSIRAWLRDDKNRPILKADIKVDEEPKRLKDLPELINTLLDKSVAYLAEKHQTLLVEFFLPNTLLCCAIDQWPIKVGTIQKKMGALYKVVVRSLERARYMQTIAGQLWRDKWNIVQEFAYGKPELIAEVNGFLLSCDKVRAKQATLSATLNNHPYVCIVLTFVPPSPRSSTNGKHVFDAVFSVGIPIALWPRKHAINNGSLNIEKFIKSISPQTILNLPHIVLEQRREAEESEDVHHAGNHLTLLWDDPNRVPPDITTKRRLVEPTSNEKGK